jgi:dienelactone hydrolase
MAPFLIQVASQGVVVIANGSPQANGTGTFASFGTAGRSSYKSLLSSIDWVEKNAGKGDWAHLDPTRIVAAGQSCGGGEAYGVANDPRVKALGIFNSGGMQGMGGNTNNVNTFTKPIFYFLGGPSDLAYQNVRTLPHFMARVVC